MTATQNMTVPAYSQSTILSVLSRTPADALKLFADALIPALEPIRVIYNRTGLVMLPYTDTAQGSIFHLGEVLIAEARVQILDGMDGTVEGYGACLGYDVEQALGIALLDAALTADVQADAIRQFVHEQAQAQAADDEALLRAVESTRAEMVTF